MIIHFFGLKSINEAIKNNYQLVNLYCTNLNYVPLNIPKEKIAIRPKDFFNKYNHVNHQYFVGEFEIDIKEYNIKTALEEIANNDLQTILILDEIEDARNFGAILRNAYAFNVDLVIYKNDHQAPINDLVIKTSMGAVHHLRMVKVPNINNAIEKLKNAGFWIYASNLDNDALDFNEVNFDKKCAVIIGNENKGVSTLTTNNADFKIKIKMNNNIDSLNVSVASGIILQKIYTQS